MFSMVWDRQHTRLRQTLATPGAGSKRQKMKLAVVSHGIESSEVRDLYSVFLLTSPIFLSVSFEKLCKTQSHCGRGWSISQAYGVF